MEISESEGGLAQEPLEAVVLGIFRALLPNSVINADDNFFAAGGDSLTATELLVQLEDAFGVVLDPGSLLEAATPRAVAAAIIEARNAS